MTFVSHWLKILSLAISVCFVVTRLCPLPNVTDENIYFKKDKYILNIICYDVTSKFNVYNITSYCINGYWFPPLTNICKGSMKEEYSNNFHKWPEFSNDYEHRREIFKYVSKSNQRRLKRSPNVGKFEALKRHEFVDRKISEGILETAIDPNTPGVVRVHPGGKAFLLCRVENLGTNSVMWFIGDKVLSIDTSIFVPDKRFFLSFDSETGTWILEINKVKMIDQGNYTCQVSNRPTIRHIVSLQVIPNGKPLLPTLKKKRRRRRKKNIRQDKQNLALEELRQNLSTVWAEINDLKVSLETHIKESDPQYYYDPTDHHHHDDHHGHQEGEHHGDYHHDDHYHDHHHHEGENQTVEGRSLESGYDHAYDDHHSHHEYDHHHHHHDYYDHHSQHEGSENIQNPHNESHHHHDDGHGDHHAGGHDDHHAGGHDDHHAGGHDDHHAGDHDVNQASGKDDEDDKDSHSQEDDDDDNSEENVVNKAKTGYYGRSRNDGPQNDSQDQRDQGRQHYHQRRHHQKEDFLKAHCHLLPNSEVPTSNVTGHITITQNKDATGPLFFKIYMKGFEVSPEDGLGYVHGFHIHENEIKGQQCSSAGPHFNPFGKTHGAPYAVIRHVGDLGNIRVDDKGRFENRVISDDIVSFFGKRSIIGRSIVVHEKVDDLGLGGDEESLKTGNAGARLACCTIESINIPNPVKPVIRFNG